MTERTEFEMWTGRFKGTNAAIEALLPLGIIFDVVARHAV
jgi:hypothetical protein